MFEKFIMPDPPFFYEAQNSVTEKQERVKINPSFLSIRANFFRNQCRDFCGNV